MSTLLRTRSLLITTAAVSALTVSVAAVTWLRADPVYHLVVPGASEHCEVRVLLPYPPQCRLEVPELDGRSDLEMQFIEAGAPFQEGGVHGPGPRCGPFFNVWGPTESWWTLMLILPAGFRGEVPCHAPGCELIVTVADPETQPTQPTVVQPIRGWQPHEFAANPCQGCTLGERVGPIQRAWLRKQGDIRVGLNATLEISAAEIETLSGCLQDAPPAPRRGLQECFDRVGTLKLLTEHYPTVLELDILPGNLLEHDERRYLTGRCLDALLITGLERSETQMLRADSIKKR
jgi:hypothetical protein